MTSGIKRALQAALGVTAFVAGMAAGSLHARSAVAQNRFGQPKTVLHVVVYKFRDNVSNYDRERAINGIKDMAGKIPGVQPHVLDAGQFSSPALASDGGSTRT